VSTTASKDKGRGKGAQGGSKRRSKATGGAPQKAAEFFDRLLPDSDEQSGTAYADRKARLKSVHKADYTFDRAVKAFDRIEEELDKNEQTVEQREWTDRDRRRESDEEARQRREIRKDIRTVVEVEERRRAIRHKDILLGLTVIATVAAVVLAYLAVKYDQVAYVGVSAFTTALSGAGAFAYFRGPQADSAENIEAEEPQFRWSVLDLQTEVEPEEPG
jgi:hypothetical protein